MATSELHSVASGLEDGSALLLSNSLGATMAMWSPQLPLLEQHFKVIRYDTRGHGDSKAPPVPYSFDDLVSDAFAVLDHHGAETASVMGLSLGGMTALGMGLTQPNRIERVVCCAARADAPPPFVQSWDDRVALMDRDGLEALWPGTLPRWLTDRFQENHPDKVTALKQQFLKTSPEGYRGCAAALKTLAYLPKLGGLTQPALFIAGADDIAAPPDCMRVMAANAGAGRYVEVKAAAHIINQDNPIPFNQAIASFFNL